ncbi:MAG: DNA-3-methyladenine glycosylase [Moheibacter sp.]
MNRISKDYFIENDTLSIAKGLIGKTLVRDFGNGEILKSKIIETEAYIGEQDLACHASKGKTERNKIMFEDGGLVYVYLIYGLYWMLNFVTEKADHPAAALIRGIEECSGPGRVGRLLKLDKSFYGENLETSNRIWIEDSIIQSKIIATPRIGIDYSGEIWKNKPWRFVVEK